MRLLLINLFLYSFIIAQIPSKDFDKWNVLQEGEIWIGYIETDFPWCKASINLPYSTNEILSIVENIDDYYKILDSVMYSKKNDNDIAHIKINYPFPFTDRDYVVKFERFNDNDDIVYAFSTNKELNLNIDENFIRLINAKGEWRLSPINKKLTQVTYIWNGELRGNFPSWSLSKAWIRHGNEVLGNLRDKLRENNED